MLPGLVEGVELAPENLHVMRRAQRLHLLEALFLFAVRFRVFVADHHDKVVELETQQSHGKSGFLRSILTKASLAVADQLQVRPRRESGNLRELAPCERRSALALAVVVEYVLAIIFIFNNRFHHDNKLGYLKLACNKF